MILRTKVFYFWCVLSGAVGVLTTSPARGQGVPATPNLRETEFPPLQRRILNVLGDRLKKPGKESLTITGTLDEFAGGQKTSTSAVNIVWQFPGIMRMDYSGAQESSLIFDGVQVKKQAGSVTPSDKDLAESVIKDSAETFLLGRFSGSAVQLMVAGDPTDLIIDIDGYLPRVEHL